MHEDFSRTIGSLIIAQLRLGFITLLAIQFCAACGPPNDDSGQESRDDRDVGVVEPETPDPDPQPDPTPEPDGFPDADVGGTDAGADSGMDAEPEESLCEEEVLSELYTQYVEPFVSGQVPQSCSSCHMTGVDMSIYAQDTPCQTMACMQQMGAVDLDDPPSSAILQQILMGDPESSVFDVQDEHDAILEWIEWSSTCHDDVCGDVQDACSTGTGAPTTGQTPIGDCSEEALLAQFWDSVIIHRGRCASCHTQSVSSQTFGDCTQDSDCNGNQQCFDGLCRPLGPFLAPNFLEGGAEALVWSDPDDHRTGLNSMYNVLSMGMVDFEEPLNSSLLTKPLLENFTPTAIYGQGVAIEANPDSVGTGVYHGGSSKFSFGCHQPPCPTEAVVDCRKERSCQNNSACRDTEMCSNGHCRLRNSVCDETYVNYVRFVLFIQSCRTQQ